MISSKEMLLLMLYDTANKEYMYPAGNPSGICICYHAHLMTFPFLHNYNKVQWTDQCKETHTYRNPGQVACFEEKLTTQCLKLVKF